MWRGVKGPMYRGEDMVCTWVRPNLVLEVAQLLGQRPCRCPNDAAAGAAGNSACRRPAAQPVAQSAAQHVTRAAGGLIGAPGLRRRVAQFEIAVRMPAQR